MTHIPWVQTPPPVSGSTRAPLLEATVRTVADVTALRIRLRSQVLDGPGQSRGHGREADRGGCGGGHDAISFTSESVGWESVGSGAVSARKTSSSDPAS